MFDPSKDKMSFATVSFIARSPLVLLNAAKCGEWQVRRESRAATTEFVKKDAVVRPVDACTAGYAHPVLRSHDVLRILIDELAECRRRTRLWPEVDRDHKRVHLAALRAFQ
jgi:hypothetical protein